MTGVLAGQVLERAHRSLALAPLRVLLVLAVSFVAACGSMTVQVDVIDPAYVETVGQQAQLQTQLREALRPADEKNAKYERIREGLERGLEQMIDVARQDAQRAERQGQLAEARVAQAAADSLTAAKGAPLSEFIGLTTKLNALDEQIKEAIAEQPAARGGPSVVEPPLRDLLFERQVTAEAAVGGGLALLDQIAAVERGESLGGPMPLTGPPRTVPIDSPTRQVEVDLKSITGGLTLTESTLAYAVASAPEDKWAREFNRTFGRGTFGNLNFAVKMVDLADFTIKGVAFDPSKVAQVASKVTTQSLLLAAQIAGVPVTGLSLGPTDIGSALATQSAALDAVLEANERFAAQEQLRQNAIIAILTRIAEEANNLSGNEAQRNEAQRAILATYNAYKELLQYSSR